MVIPGEAESEFPLQNISLIYPCWFPDVAHFFMCSRQGKTLLLLNNCMTPPRNYSCSFRVYSVLTLCVPPVCTLRHFTIKICSGKLVLNHYLIHQLVSHCQRFTPIPFAADIYPLIWIPLNLKFNEERDSVIPVMLGVQCCSCVRIKLDRYQLSALGVIDSKWKFIGSNLSLFSVVCSLGFPTIYKQRGVWDVKRAKLQHFPWSPSCACQGTLLRMVSVVPSISCVHWSISKINRWSSSNACRTVC